MACRYDENNQNVMRDLSLLQAYLKDYEGFCETRRKIMIGRAGIITNWIVYYISLYLSKNYETALEVFDSIIGQYGEDKSVLKPHEISELYLFKVNILIEMGENKKAIKFMTKKTTDKAIMDDVRKNEILVKLYL
jgi:peptide alpha-N-acetyltransferase